MRRDECGESIIPGRQGQINEYGDGELGTMFMPTPTKDDRWGKWCPRTWGNFKKSCPGHRHDAFARMAIRRVAYHLTQPMTRRPSWQSRLLVCVQNGEYPPKLSLGCWLPVEPAVLFEPVRRRNTRWRP